MSTRKLALHSLFKKAGKITEKEEYRLHLLQNECIWAVQVPTPSTAVQAEGASLLSHPARPLGKHASDGVPAEQGRQAPCPSLEGLYWFPLSSFPVRVSQRSLQQGKNSLKGKTNGQMDGPVMGRCFTMNWGQCSLVL